MLLTHLFHLPSFPKVRQSNVEPLNQLIGGGLVIAQGSSHQGSLIVICLFPFQSKWGLCEQITVI